MPQPPNMQKMLKQVQKMQQDMLAAQEQLKDEEVEASAGGGMVKVKMTGDLQREVAHDRPRRGRPRGRRDAAGHGPGRGQRGAARGAGARRERSSAASTGGLGGLGRRSAALGPARRLVERRACYAPPVQRLDHRARQAARASATRTAQRLAFHILRADAEDALALADAIREVKEKIGLCEICFNLADGPALHDLPGRAPRPAA